jgi:hypothetical protein
MAVEVVNEGTWAFVAGDAKELQSIAEERRALELDEVAISSEVLGDSGTNPSSNDRDLSPRSLPPFFHTPIHDIEALYWMIWWTITVRSFSEDNTAMVWQVELYNSIFVEKGKKTYLTSSSDITQSWVYKIKPNVPDISYGYLYCTLISNALVDGYKALESMRDNKLDHDAYSDPRIPRTMVKLFSQLAIHAKRRPSDVRLYGHISGEEVDIVEKRPSKDMSMSDQQAANKSGE